MLKKIISGGQTGADQAALDVAIKFGIPHGGWIPKGRKTETGPLPSRYFLQEMPHGGYAGRTEKNVLESDGTLILSHGQLTGGSELTRRLAEKHGRPCLHLDLAQVAALEATKRLLAWLNANTIEVLNVAGPRASHDPRIYPAVFKILQTAMHMETMANYMPALFQPLFAGRQSAPATAVPQSIDQAVEALISKLSFKNKTVIANMSASKLTDLRFTLGRNIVQGFNLDKDNRRLLESCRSSAGEPDLSADDAALLIVRALWQKLQKQKNRLKVIRNA